MTDLITKLRADALERRKYAAKHKADADPLRADAARVSSVHATLLATLAAEAAMIGKNDGGREPTDDETSSTIRKFLKGVDASIEQARNDDERNKFLVEKRILEAYLPQPLEGGYLTDAINAAAQRLGLPIEMRSVKALVADLQADFPGRVDAGAVARYVRGIEAKA